MSPRRRIQTEVSETDDHCGLAQRMSPRRKVPDGWAHYLELSVSGTSMTCHLSWPYVWRRRITDGCPRDGGSETDVPETEVQQTEVSETERRR